MNNKQKGLSLAELAVIVIILLAAIFFVIPKFLPEPQIDSSQSTGKEVISTIYSAYKLCMLEDKNEHYSCNTSDKIIENINYESIDRENMSIILLNQAKVEFIKNDNLKNGTIFAVTLPEKKEKFNIYISNQGNISTKPFINEQAKGGKVHTETTINLNNI